MVISVVVAGEMAGLRAASLDQSRPSDTICSIVLADSTSILMILRTENKSGHMCHPIQIIHDAFNIIFSLTFVESTKTGMMHMYICTTVFVS